MAKTIVWTKKANDSFNNVIAYLQKDWNDTVIRNFVNRTYNLIEMLSENYEIGTIENKAKNIRGFLITKHNILFYRTTDTQIILLNLYDTRSNKTKY